MEIRHEKINLSPESLILVWKWFLKVAQIRKASKGELRRLKEELSIFPESFQEHVVKDSSKELTIVKEYILRDIGMYIGEVFNKEYNHIKWGYYSKSKSDMFVNKPVLMGFKDTSYDPPFETEFEPIHMVGVQATKLFDGTQKESVSKNIFATFYIEYNGKCFPGDRWTDFPFEVLHMWCENIIDKIIDNTNSEFQLFFMDGPYGINCVKMNESIKLEFMNNREETTIEGYFEISSREFINSVCEVSTDLIELAKKQKLDKTRGVRRLNRLIKKIN